MPPVNDTFRFMPLYKAYDQEKLKDRPDYRIDYARVLHSPSFRRLEHKTQLFPGYESDFFRNRLTHSLEVAQIAKSIGIKISKDYTKIPINPDVCEIAGMIHDLGHPPFGHNGEYALDECMKSAGGFEGNAQTLRIITRIEKKEESVPHINTDGSDNRVGLNLTARVIAAAIKYDNMIPLRRSPKDKLQKGYYRSESELVKIVKQQVTGIRSTELPDIKFKTIECSIMDLADDIAYSTYDMEDAFKAGFLTPYEIMSADRDIFERIVDKLSDSGLKINVDECRSYLFGFFSEIWEDSINDMRNLDKDDPYFDQKALSILLSSYRYSKAFASDGYLRTRFSSNTIERLLSGITVQYNSTYPVLSQVDFDEETKIIVNILKHFTYVSQIESSRLKVAENRGKDIVSGIFEKLCSPNGERLLPEDFQSIYFKLKHIEDQKRLVCDFIAGMTDRYAIEFYGRLYSENPQSIFKPL